MDGPEPLRRRLTRALHGVSREASRRGTTHARLNHNGIDIAAPVGLAVSNAPDVTPGQAIGRTGEEGSLEGPALHFEVRKGSSAMDPESWLR